MAISKVQYKTSSEATPIVWMDATPATASASDILSPMTAMLADGVITTGTGSGGGSGGLMYETGTWTPAEDVSSYTIPFINTHSVAPSIYVIAEATAQTIMYASSNVCVAYSNIHQITGAACETDNDTYYGFVMQRYTTSGNAMTGATANLVSPYTNASDSTNTQSRYWAKETGIKATSSSSSRYWRSGRTYKWIAVWTPTV